ncbi:MAG: LytR/AlgR family response regulator transcription factor [Gammaproteobacteria bacterium]
MNVLIVDDEPLARQRLRSQLEELGLATVVGEADSGIAAIEQCGALGPDLVLLDVRMPGMDGIEAAQHLARLPSPPLVVFVTAYDEHALAAFETRALAYLLKPVRSEQLKDALERALVMRAGRSAIAAGDGDGLGRRRHVSAVVGGSLRLMSLDEVCYFQADQGYVSAVSASGRLLVEESLRALEEEFGDEFVRVHRNALVNVNQVESLSKDREGNAVVVVRGSEERLPVSRRLLPAVRKRLRAG